MQSLFTFTSPPTPCGYLPDRHWQLKYEVVGQVSSDEFHQRLRNGWRRFGYALFKPNCPNCKMCQSLRVPVATFQPDRSQRRAWAKNEADVTLSIGEPDVTREKLDLYDKFHRFQHSSKGWPEHAPKNASDYVESFVDNPFPTEEWVYRLNGAVVGVGYVDVFGDAYSAIYFYHDPELRDRSLGTFNVLSILRRAKLEQQAYLYLGYYVAGCRSLEYKARYQPNEVFTGTGEWMPFSA